VLDQSFVLYLRALLRIANCLFDLNALLSEKNLLAKIRESIEEIYDEATKSTMLQELAVIVAKLHKFQEARLLVEKWTTAEDRLAAYTAILREYHIERNPSLARLFAEEAADAEEED
jgi:hypothetical protein